MGKRIKKIEGLYTCYKHNKTRLRYHIILVTKYRRACLNKVEDYLYESFNECCKQSDITIHNMKADKDHIHLLVSFPPKYSISQTVNRLKQFSTIYLYKYYNNYLSKFYWKHKRVLWSDSYFCSTVGTVSEQKVYDYINSQG